VRARQYLLTEEVYKSLIKEEQKKKMKIFKCSIDLDITENKFTEALCKYDVVQERLQQAVNSLSYWLSQH
jgi:hypothetical protein